MRVKVCTMSEIGDGEVRTFEAEGTEGVIIRSGDRFFAIQRYCTHELFPMEFGMLQDESTLRCTFSMAPTSIWRPARRWDRRRKRPSPPIQS